MPALGSSAYLPGRHIIQVTPDTPIRNHRFNLALKKFQHIAYRKFFSTKIIPYQHPAMFFGT